MNGNEIADALVAWALATCTDLDGSYDHDPAKKTQPLPDVAAFITEERVDAADITLGVSKVARGLEQAEARFWRVSLLLMVDPEPAGTATEQLQTFVDELGEALRSDPTLGARVHSASQRWQAGYEPPFVEYDDGTKARMATFSFTVAELI